MDDPNIHIKNRYVPNDELAKDICDSRVAVFPYSSSTGTHTVQTSLALGCKVVATDVGSFKELLTVDSGLVGDIVPYGNIKKLVACMRESLETDFDCSASAEKFSRIYSVENWAQFVFNEVKK